MSDFNDMNEFDQLEYVHYLRRCSLDHAETYRACQTIAGYTQAQRDSACAEAAYWHDRGELPAWGSVIEQVVSNHNGNIFVHRDLSKLT